MNLDYLKYLFRKYRYLYFFTFLVYFFTFGVITSFINNENRYILKTLVFFPTVILMTLGCLIPLISHLKYYNQNAMNVMFSLPEKRAYIYRTNILFHLFLNLIIFVVDVLIGILLLLVKQVNLDYAYLFGYMGLMCVVFVATYMFNCFIVSRAKNFIDAFILMVAYALLPAFVLFAIYVAIDRNQETFLWHNLSLIGCADYTARYFIQKAITPIAGEAFRYDFYIYFSVLGLLSYFISVRTIANLKPETVNGPTTSLFGYKIIIPAYVLVGCIIANYQNALTFVLMLIIVTVCYFVFSLLANRSFKFTWRILIEFIIVVVVANLIVYFL